MDKEKLKLELKKMIIVECDREDDFSAEDIADDEVLIGMESNMDLDSLDSLQISLAVQRDYEVRIEGAKDGRVALASINALANYIVSNK